MNTGRIRLTKEWQQFASATGVVTLKVITGNCKICVSDAAPSEDFADWFPVNIGDQPYTFSDTVTGWIKGDGIVAIITV